MDAYEFSFVAVPAQRNAGASKTSTGAHADEAQAPKETPCTPAEPNDSEKAAELAMQAELAAIRAKNTIIN